MVAARSEAVSRRRRVSSSRCDPVGVPALFKTILRRADVSVPSGPQMQAQIQREAGLPAPAESDARVKIARFSTLWQGLR